MAFWQFLLQKEGDRSWQPLALTEIEISEGRYRVVAHSNQVRVPVEVRITHETTTSTPPIRRTQRRFGKTNPDGLIVIMPFTRLLPGTWELRCTGDVMSDMLGEGWQHRVRLHVL